MTKTIEERLDELECLLTKVRDVVNSNAKSSCKIAKKAGELSREVDNIKRQKNQGYDIFKDLFGKGR